MRVLFEDNGWQIISYDTDLVYLLHEDCAAYVLLQSIKKGCTVCRNSAPEGMQALVILHNWGYE